MNTPPYLLRRLLELGAIDDSGGTRLLRDGIATPADLHLAIAERRPAILAQPSLVTAASEMSLAHPPLTLGRAWEIADGVVRQLTRACPMIEHVDVAGDARRYCPLVGNIAIVARAVDTESAIAAVQEMPGIGPLSFRTPRRAVFGVQGHEVDLRVAPPGEFGTVLFTSTGPAAHVAAVLARRGTPLSASEEDVYERAGLTYLPPELRDCDGALEIASRSISHPLVTLRDVRGDLHMHTTYSDGRDSLQTMLEAAAALGYEYVAITDHSEHAAASHTMRPDELKRQRDEIDALRERFPAMTILQGIEADILEDGSIDCPDAVLSRLDVVLASLHERHGHGPEQLTERCLRAIQHPLVSILTHPANQLVGHRAGYEMDYDRIFEAAAANGTILEIDGAPSHLDLDGDRARVAVQAGVMVSIDSDCHRAAALRRQMAFGVGTARRGGVMPSQVANTRPLPELRRVLGRKRVN